MNHGKCPEGMECACCYDDIVDGKGGNYVEYRTGEGHEWRPSLFCKACIQVLIKRQWPIYQESLAKATCKAQQKRMLGEGPPTHVHDKKALACPEGESVHSLWFVGDDDGEPQIQSALLEGAPQGEARQIWWDEKLAFQFDEDDEEEEAAGGGQKNAPATATSAVVSALPPVPGTPTPSSHPPPPATAPAATTTQGGNGTESGAASTESPPPASDVPASDAAGKTDEVAVGVQIDAVPSEMEVEEGASAVSTTNATPKPVATTSSVTDAAPANPSVPLA